MTAFAAPLLSPGSSARWWRALLVLLAAAFVAVAASGGPHRAVVAGLAIATAALFAVATARPGLALGALLLVLPTQLVVSSWLYHLGLPGSAAHALGNVKDILVAAVVARAILQRDRTPLDRLDRFALGYVALLTVYLLVPGVAHGLLGSTPFQQRLLEWRVLGWAALVLVAARRLPISDRLLRRLLWITVGMGVVIAACGVFEAILPDTWNSIMVHNIGVPAYKHDVIGLDVDRRNVINHTVVGGHSFVRAGSIFANPLVAGFALFVGWAVCLARLSRERVRPGVVVLSAAIGAGIVVTVTRSAILGALVAAIAVVRIGVSERYEGRIRLALLLVAAATLLAPFIGSTSLGARTSAAVQGSDVSAQKHIESVQNGVRVLVRHPLGQGLGTGPGVGDRFGVANKVTSEDFYLGVADETGIVGGLLFIAMFVALMRELRRASRLPVPHAWVAGALYAAGWGYAVGALFLHVWLDFTSSLTFFGLAAVAVGAATRGQTEQDVTA